MLRRWLRIFCVVGLVVIVGMAVMTQFWEFVLYTPYGLMAIQNDGTVFTSYHASRWVTGFYRLPSFPVHVLYDTPNWHVDSTKASLFLPWWLLLLTWGLLTAVIWRMTRRRKAKQGFPIEPSAKPK